MPFLSSRMERQLGKQDRGQKEISGIFKANINGLRQQSFACRAEIKLSCISNILPSVLLRRTLKSNGKLSGNLWVQQR